MNKPLYGLNPIVSSNLIPSANYAEESQDTAAILRFWALAWRGRVLQGDLVTYSPECIRSEIESRKSLMSELGCDGNAIGAETISSAKRSPGLIRVEKGAVRSNSDR
jgi:hypothetical protein